MAYCDQCAALQAELAEAKRRLDVYRTALSDTRFIADEALRHVGILDTPIEHLELSVRADNCVRGEKITTVGELISYGEQRLRHTRGMGRRSITEIKEALAQYGLALRP